MYSAYSGTASSNKDIMHKIQPLMNLLNKTVRYFPWKLIVDYAKIKDFDPKIL